MNTKERFATAFKARKGHRPRLEPETPADAPPRPSRAASNSGPAKNRRLERYRLLARLKAAKNRIAELEAECDQLRGLKRPDWISLALEVQRLLLTRPQPGAVSVIALAAALGVHERLVFKWLHGQCRPTAEMQKRIDRWLQDARG